MPKEKLLICDVDGTLVNSNAGFSLAIKDLLKVQFQQDVETNQIVPHSGLPLREIIELFVGPINTGIYHRAAKYYRDLYNSKFINQIDLFPSIKESLRELSSYCYLSTATNLPSKQTHLLFERLELSQFFDKIRGTDASDPPKPDPGLLIEAMTEFNIDKTSTFMVGDSFNDIKAGKNADVKTIAVCYQGDNQHLINSLNPDFKIKQFDQILDIIER